MADKKATENKADLTSNATTPEVVAPLNGAAAPDGKPTTEIFSEIKTQISEKDNQIEILKKEIEEKDNQIARLSVVQPYPTANTARSFEVIKDYAGIDIGEVVTSDNKSQIAYMLQQGYWKEV